MTIEIQNIDDLIEFINENFNNINHQEYTTLIRETLSAYTNGKPVNVETSIYQIKTHWELVKDLPVRDRPLFLEQEGEDFDVKKHLHIFIEKN